MNLSIGKPFHNRLYKSKINFINEYKAETGRKPSGDEVFPILLTEFEKAVAENDEEHLQQLNAIAHYIPVDASKKSLLHHAVLKNQVKTATCLIKNGSDVNAKDDNGLTPLHLAAQNVSKEITQILLDHGAIFDAVDRIGRKPFNSTSNEAVKKVFSATEQFMDAAKFNICSNVERQIEEGAVVNARRADSETALHHAAFKGYSVLVSLLLNKRANPNLTGKNGFTPLHYAAQRAHVHIVKDLLFHGAVYNLVDDSGKTPSDYTANEEIIKLFKMIGEFFVHVAANNDQFVGKINKLKDMQTVKAVMGAKNRDKRTLLVVALLTDFSKVEELKRVCQPGVHEELLKANSLLDGGKFEDALRSFKSAYEGRKKILGPDSPGTLDIERYVAHTIYKLGNFQEAVDMYEEVFKKQVDIFGYNSQRALLTRSFLALVLHRWGKSDEALKIYEDVHRRQNELLGEYHEDTVTSLFHKGLTLDGLNRFRESQIIYKDVYLKRKKMLGDDHIDTVVVQNNIGMNLAREGKKEEALKMIRDVFRKKKSIFGINHSEPMRTLHNIAALLSSMKKYSEAIKTYYEVLKIQKSVLPENHPDTFNTKFNLAGELMQSKKPIRALKLYRELLVSFSTVYGPKHPQVSQCKKHIRFIESVFQDVDSSEAEEILESSQDELMDAVRGGNVRDVKAALEWEADVNGRDEHGRTPLHFAISLKYIDVVKLLLKKGADVTEVTDKGNTSLHTAVLTGSVEIVDLLLKEVNSDKAVDFVNVQTFTGKNTALHVAAKSGFFDLVKLLLRNGAVFEVVNADGKMPIDLATNGDITNLLTVVKNSFHKMKVGKARFIVDGMRKLKKRDEMDALMNARDGGRRTLKEVGNLCNLDFNFVCVQFENDFKLDEFE